MLVLTKHHHWGVPRRRVRVDTGIHRAQKRGGSPGPSPAFPSSPPVVPSLNLTSEDRAKICGWQRGKLPVPAAWC
ncbi:hypothetical protein Cob_v003713 [Colletotrichum orbiculare MAFF 240422]|uniref:Uncharacterized protein n=1 Tax=Colletotrichum orbiculare (strain 104-T / ATCC 96160 / CBS 514.97 / LARS 414 / MAFF 240422) TaxID=1213857 RepID=A0A484FYZ3_COLOR|nr:hypothetical protein Cob_v003713 [Colletotrichum orbiculare MAFF 240422]